ncbi:MAG: ThuA domain-containing protein [Verrucomicrobiales bacterium]|nr:ThuA domain-containing protein [Verrucomicrobiales bacterium]
MVKTTNFWKTILPAVLLFAVIGFAWAQTKKEPLKILLIAGGCCHDYATQTKLLKAGIEERLNAEVTVEYNPDKSTKATFKVYESEDWAKGYDIVIHDECSASVTDRAYVKRILDAHKAGVPAVNLHCAMHSYRWDDFRTPVELSADNAGWYEMIGLQSTGHGPQSPIDIKFADSDHPTTSGLKDWTTINEELYNNVQIFDGTTALAVGHQLQMPRGKKGKDGKRLPPPADAVPTKAEAVVIWANEYGPKKTKIFSTSLGHNNETVADSRYLDLITRGLLWVSGNIKEDGTAVEGAGR